MYRGRGVEASRRSQVGPEGPAGASASVQHGSQFGWEALRLPPLGVTQLEPFLEAEKEEGRC